MIEKKVKYIDYNGKEREESCWFHTSEAELTKWALTDGDYSMQDKITRIVEKRNGKEVMKAFDELLRLSYGEKSLDGRKFIKNDEVLSNFVDTPMYDKIFMELITDDVAAAEFINGIMPKDMKDKLDAAIKEDPELAKQFNMIETSSND